MDEVTITPSKTARTWSPDRSISPPPTDEKSPTRRSSRCVAADTPPTSPPATARTCPSASTAPWPTDAFRKDRAAAVNDPATQPSLIHPRAGRILGDTGHQTVLRWTGASNRRWSPLLAMSNTAFPGLHVQVLAGPDRLRPGQQSCGYLPSDARQFHTRLIGGDRRVEWLCRGTLHAQAIVPIRRHSPDVLAPSRPGSNRRRTRLEPSSASRQELGHTTPDPSCR
jgi:hypothetical protein